MPSPSFFRSNILKRISVCPARLFQLVFPTFHFPSRLVCSLYSKFLVCYFLAFDFLFLLFSCHVTVCQVAVIFGGRNSQCQTDNLKLKEADKPTTREPH